MKTHERQFRVTAMRRAFGVSRSGSYGWGNQGCTRQQARADAVLTEQIRTIFERSRQTYGRPRVYVESKEGYIPRSLLR
jgi:hypothetical protein